MGIKTKRPTTHSQRWMTYTDFAEITKAKPEKSWSSRRKAPAAATQTGA